MSTTWYSTNYSEYVYAFIRILEYNMFLILIVRINKVCNNIIIIFWVASDIDIIILLFCMVSTLLTHFFCAFSYTI